MHTAHDAQVSLQTKTLKQAIIFPLQSRQSDRKSSKDRSPPLHNHYNNNTNNNNSNKHSQFISHWGGVNIYIRFFSKILQHLTSAGCNILMTSSGMPRLSSYNSCSYKAMTYRRLNPHGLLTLKLTEQQLQWAYAEEQPHSCVERSTLA